MVVFLSIMALHAALSARTAESVTPQSMRSSPTAAAISTPESRSNQPVRISKPSDLYARATISNGPSPSLIEGAIAVPANARAGLENSLATAATAAVPEIDSVPGPGIVYGVSSIRRHGGSTYGVRRVGGAHWRGVGVDSYAAGSIFDDTADDAFRRAQLRFYEASYPRLDTFEDAHRRAQLEFHRATLTPGTRGPDGLRRDRGGLNGPGLRREAWSGRRW